MVRSRPIPRAFTLTELLVAIGIAAVLITLVVGVIARVKQAAYRSATAASIAALQGAIENYYQNFKAYPGPVSDEAVCGLTATGLTDVDGMVIPRVTMSENLVLGLLGGLNASGNYDQGLVGRALFMQPGSASPGKQMQPFYGANDRLTPRSYRPNTNPPQRTLESGHVVGFDGLALWSENRPDYDSNITEFLDTFPDAMPILYYRAHRNALGVASDSGDVLAQYDVRQNNVYLDLRLGLPHLNIPAPHQPWQTPQPRVAGHGLREAGAYVTPDKRVSNYHFNLTTFMASPSDTSRARVPDGYVLVSAGPDRIYGTDDDVVSFGKVAP